MTRIAAVASLIVPGLLAAAMTLAQPAGAQCTPKNPVGPLPPHEADLLYLPTPHHVVAAMLRLAEVSAVDVVYDLGSGDGRIPIAAARDFGARGVGVELDSSLVEAARCNARVAGLEKSVEFRHQNLLAADLREATVITLFLLPDMNRQLAPKLRSELRPGSRIVSHRFGIGDWKPDRVVESGGHEILLWTVP